ncbi:MAG: acyl-CoA desaturase [Pseudomonadota bacterium]
MLELIVSFLWWQFLSAFAVSAGIHRYFSHRAFQAPVWYEYAVLILGPLSGSGSVLGWAGVHRMHHKYSDTDRDPHSPHRVGNWRVLTSTFKVPPIPPRLIADLLRNRRVVFFHRHHRKIRLGTFLLGLVLLPFPWFLVFICSPVVYGYLGFGLLNIICHKVPFEVKNSWLVNLFTGGDGWHANHHKRPSSPRIGEQWWQWDFGYLFIWAVKSQPSPSRSLATDSRG